MLRTSTNLGGTRKRRYPENEILLRLPVIESAIRMRFRYLARVSGKEILEVA